MVETFTLYFDILFSLQRFLLCILFSFIASWVYVLFLPSLLPCANMKASFFGFKPVEISRCQSINQSIEDAKKGRIVKSVYLHSG